MGINGEVSVQGTLICVCDTEAARVRAALKAHITLTRAEAGCLSFDVESSDNPLIWNVYERFSCAEAFQTHQTRTATSEWAQATQGIARDYKITGLE